MLDYSLKFWQLSRPMGPCSTVDLAPRRNRRMSKLSLLWIYYDVVCRLCWSWNCGLWAQQGGYRTAVCLVRRFTAFVGWVKWSCIKRDYQNKKCIVDVLERRLTSLALVCWLSVFCVIKLLVATTHMPGTLSTGWFHWHRGLQAGIYGYLVEILLTSLLKKHIDINTTSML